jgi:sugar phosphate isomerase/epimerase
MQLQIYRSLWGAGEDYARIAADARAAGFDGLEGQLPAHAQGLTALTRGLREQGLRYIGEICTGGSSDAYWIPVRAASVDEHLRSLAAGIERLLDSGIPFEFINCMGGLDAWPLAANVDFFGRAMDLGNAYGVTLSFETHRARSMFSPWATQAIVEALPDLRITCDFSHWCVVAERLIDEEVEALAAVCPRAFHIQCRVGYEQGPQVPHPAAPEYRYALIAHQRWWAQVWQQHRAQGREITTMTPEFGPNGYLQAAPFTGMPVGDLWEINRWMADTERRHFADWTGRW